MKKILTTIGLPFSGKSTLAKEYEKDGWEIVQRDEVLDTLITSDDFKKALEKGPDINKDRDAHFEFKKQLATNMLTQRLDTIFEQLGDKIFYDATNIHKSTRSHLLTFKEKGYSVDAVVLQTPIDEILKRAENAKREGFHSEAFKALPYFIHTAEDLTGEEEFDNVYIKEWVQENKEPQKEIQNNEIKMR